ncbi:MAG: AAC(3) family N-acetyltransferase [Actinobacteria bacterium]|nr:AAC(3) family N-acetyltransferase [Actinomycetota bacterium]
MAHTDAARTHSLLGAVRGRTELLAAHGRELAKIADGRDVWFPTFNYGFLRTRHYSVDDDPSQVGAINESVRQQGGWRTSTPVFNFTGTGGAPVDLDAAADVVLPFDARSPFGQCAQHDGTVLWYGAEISTGTILHYAEWAAGGPLYRYDKDFVGRIERGTESREVTLRYHVRPMEKVLEYDWPRITADLVSAGILRDLVGPVRWAPARDLVEFWVDRMTADPLYLLDTESREWVEPALERLGRRFELEDYEAKA